MDDARRGALLSTKLTVLARPHLGGLETSPLLFPGGAGMVAGSAAWFLLDRSPVASLGPALVVAGRQGATDVHLVMEREHAGVLARRATCFAPAPTVWAIEGNELVAGEADPPPVLRPAPSAPELAELLVDADLEVIVEDGLVRGEVLGLEVARIVHGTTTDGTPIDHPVLEVGVGHADREMTALVHAGLPPTAQLARVIDIVLADRRVGAERHPLNQLAPERWMRSRLMSDPARIGLATLHAAEGSVPRPNLRDRAVAFALGTRPDGSPVVVACSVGVDLDLVPAAADARLVNDPEADLLLVVPERDALPVTVGLAARLTRPAEVVTLPGDWRE
jgi:hypothetical protein